MRILWLLHNSFWSTKGRTTESRCHQWSLLGSSACSSESVFPNKGDKCLEILRVPSPSTKYSRLRPVEFINMERVCLWILGEFVSELACISIDQCIFATSRCSCQYHYSRAFRHFHKVSDFLLIYCEFLNCFGCIFVNPHFCIFSALEWTISWQFWYLIESALIQIDQVLLHDFWLLTSLRISIRSERALTESERLLTGLTRLCPSFAFLSFLCWCLLLPVLWFGLLDPAIICLGFLQIDFFKCLLLVIWVRVFLGWCLLLCWRIAWARTSLH